MPKQARDPQRGCRTACRRIAAATFALTLAACANVNGIEASAPRPNVSSPATSAMPSESPLPTSDAAAEKLVTERYVEFQQACSRPPS
jgi:hypothetical protein